MVLFTFDLLFDTILKYNRFIGYHKIAYRVFLFLHIHIIYDLAVQTERMIEKMQWLTWWGRKCTDVISYRQIVHRVNTGIIAFNYIVRFVYVTTLLVYSIDSNIQCTAFCFFFILCCTPILLFVIEHVLCDDVCIGGINNDYNRINMKFGFEAAKSILANKCSENRTACNENRIQWPLLRSCVCKSQSLTTVYVHI